MSHVREIILRHLSELAPDADLERLAPTANLRQTLDIDSYDFLRLLMALNGELGVEIPEADYGRLRTLADLESYLS